MTTLPFPALPTPAQILGAPAQALAQVERSLPQGAPRVSQSLLAVVNSLPAIPVPGGAGGGPSLPFPGGPMPLGGTILASLVPAAQRSPVATSGLPVDLPTGRTGMG